TQDEDDDDDDDDGGDDGGDDGDDGGDDYFFIFLFNLYLTRRKPIEIKNLFFKGDLAKTGSSISTNIVTDRTIGGTIARYISSQVKFLFQMVMQLKLPSICEEAGEI